MSTLMELTVVLVVCPAVLAAWVDARYPQLRPARDAPDRDAPRHRRPACVRLCCAPRCSRVAELLDGPAAQATSFAVACIVITYA